MLNKNNQRKNILQCDLKSILLIFPKSAEATNQMKDFFLIYLILLTFGSRANLYYTVCLNR